MYCENCGVAVIDGAVYCAGCGSKIDTVIIAEDESEINIPQILLAGTQQNNESTLNDKTEAKINHISKTKKIINAAISVMLAILTLVSLVVLTVLIILRPVNVSKIISNTDIIGFFEESFTSDDITDSINSIIIDAAEININVDVDSMKSFMRRSDVKNEVSKIAEDYALAIVERDFDYYLTSRDIVNSIRNIAPDIRDEFGYRMTSADYNDIDNYLKTEMNLKDYRIGTIFDDNNINSEIPWFLLSVYPVIIIITLCVLFIFNIFYILRYDVNVSVKITGIIFAVYGIALIIISLFMGPLINIFSGSDIYGIIKAASSFAFVIFISGFMIVFISSLVLISRYLTKKIWHKNETKRLSIKNNKAWNITEIAVNATGLLICLVIVTTCYMAM